MSCSFSNSASTSASLLGCSGYQPAGGITCCFVCWGEVELEVVRWACVCVVEGDMHWCGVVVVGLDQQMAGPVSIQPLGDWWRVPSCRPRRSIGPQ
jgi:hypothetical protein